MWREKVQEYETQMIEDLKGLLAIKSVRNDTEVYGRRASGSRS